MVHIRLTASTDLDSYGWSITVPLFCERRPKLSRMSSLNSPNGTITPRSSIRLTAQSNLKRFLKTRRMSFLLSDSYGSRITVPLLLYEHGTCPANCVLNSPNGNSHIWVLIRLTALSLFDLRRSQYGEQFNSPNGTPLVKSARVQVRPCLNSPNGTINHQFFELMIWGIQERPRIGHPIDRCLRASMTLSRIRLTAPISANHHGVSSNSPNGTLHYWPTHRQVSQSFNDTVLNSPHGTHISKPL